MQASQISAFQTLKLSVGPSSSHTHGPILIGNLFRQWLLDHPEWHHFHHIRVVLYWSLARTGKGHATDNAILAGLEGLDPIDAPLDRINSALKRISQEKSIDLGLRSVPFDPFHDLVWAPDEQLPEHENGLAILLLDNHGNVLIQKHYYSIGGGMVREEGQPEKAPSRPEAWPYKTGSEWLQIGNQNNLKLSEIVRQNAAALHGQTVEAMDKQMMRIWSTMKDCVARGLNSQEPVLPGNLAIKRRAPQLFEAARHPKGPVIFGRDDISRLATAFAYAVNEENAASGRVVTAPTNGGCGVVPGALRACQYLHNFSDEAILQVLYTAAGIGGLIQANASISGSEVGCQGEVGAACSMAAGAIAELFGGSNSDVEYAAEIAMEHSLGLECTPMQGYVQIPCIERNGIYAAKALASAQHALTLQKHRISLDFVINKMYENGKAMHSDFKETSRAGFGPMLPDLDF
ncbi:MAG: L-serine ammonia-lyase [Acidobacteria bacterium]|nr:L-serine ammonia-lyase [Acidobacteriota bacterium]